MNARSGRSSHRLAMVAAILALAAGSTVSYAGDRKGGDGPRGSGGVGGGGGGVKSAQSGGGAPRMSGGGGGGGGQRQVRQAEPRAPREVRQQNQPFQRIERQAAQTQQRSINQAERQAREQARVDRRAVDSAQRQMQPQAPKPRIEQPREPRRQDDVTPRPRDVRRAENQAAEAARRAERQANRTARESAEAAQRAANQLKRTENRAAQDLLEQQRRDTRMAEENQRQAERRARRQQTPDQRRQQTIDDLLTRQAVRNNNNLDNQKAEVLPGRVDDRFRLDNGVAVTTRADRRRARNVINGDNNTINNVRVVNKYYDRNCSGPWSWSGHNCWRRWDCDDDFRVSISIGFGSGWCSPSPWRCSSWGWSSWGWSSWRCSSWRWSSWNRCWDPCAPRWSSWHCRPSFWCAPSFVSVVTVPSTVFVHQSFATDPVTYTTTGQDFGYYTAPEFDDPAPGLALNDLGYGDPVGELGADTYDYAVGAEDDLGWSGASTSPGTSTNEPIPSSSPSLSPTAEMERQGDLYAAPSGDLSGDIKPDRPAAGNESLLGLAWRALAAGRAEDALNKFAEVVQADSANAGPKVGYALAAAFQGRDDTAAWAMRRALASDPDAVGFLPDLDVLRPQIDALVTRLRAEAAAPAGGRIVNESDRWFLIASMEYLRQNASGAREALDRSIALDASRDSAANLKRLLGPAS